jgi:hypothetical protein
MRRIEALSIVVVLAVSAFGRVAEFPLTAHVMGKGSHHSGGGTTSTYNPTTQQWTYGVNAGSWDSETDLAVGNLIYTIDSAINKCKLEVGKDYPANVDPEKRRRKMHVQLPNGKVCNAFVNGVREANTIPNGNEPSVKK